MKLEAQQRLKGATYNERDLDTFVDLLRDLEDSARDFVEKYDEALDSIPDRSRATAVKKALSAVRWNMQDCERKLKYAKDHFDHLVKAQG